MYMPDALQAAQMLMEADPSRLKHRNGFNIAAMSFDPEMILENIRKYKPEFEMVYDVDPLKQSIAESWPNMMDDSCARQEWDWAPKFGLDEMTKDMLEKLSVKLLK
jgi:nucleoside-diphosphate-sugar epimerase